MPTSDRHLGQLDALRGIAVLGVLLVHTTVLTDLTGLKLIYGMTGQRGVQLFYMISAFTLYLSLDGERRERHPMSNYFIRRFFRIAPLFYIVIFANIVLLHVRPEFSSQLNLRFRDVLLGFFFLNGVQPKAINSVVAGGWSIAVETTFYLMLPILHRYFNSIKRTLLLFILTAPSLGYVSYFLAEKAKDVETQQFFGFLWYPVEFPIFVLGILSYHIWKAYISEKVDGSASQKEVSLLLLITSAMLYAGCLPISNEKLYFTSYFFLPLLLAVSIYPWRLLVNRFTRFIGKISYSLYLLHFFVLLLLKYLLNRLDQYPGHIVTRYIQHRGIGAAVVYLLLLGVSIPICILSWRFVEQPGIQLGRRLIAYREEQFKRHA